MLSKKMVYRLNDVVDVYTKELSAEECFIQFYFINTRRKIGIKVAPVALDIVKMFSDGSSLEHVTENHSKNYCTHEIDDLLSFLVDEQIVVPDLEQSPVLSVFEKECRFVKEWVGQHTDAWPLDKKVLIVGCGSVGGAIAEILVRGGINTFGLLDFKMLSKSDCVRHVHFNSNMIGVHKTKVLQSYLKDIRRSINVSLQDKKITPATLIDDVFDQDYDLIVNTADEPYIGYTSVLLGRWAKVKNIPIYVAGGFDAHLFSTGDFYNISEGDCVECTADFFSKSLQDWQPTYFLSEQEVVSTSTEEDVVLGGAGGCFAGTLFAASYAAMNILNFLHGGIQWRRSQSRRGEYNNLSGLIDWVEIALASKCEHYE